MNVANGSFENVGVFLTESKLFWFKVELFNNFNQANMSCYCLTIIYTYKFCELLQFILYNGEQKIISAVFEDISRTSSEGTNRFTRNFFYDFLLSKNRYN